MGRKFFKVIDTTYPPPRSWVATFADEDAANDYADELNSGKTKDDLLRHMVELIGDKGRAEDAAKEARDDAEKIREALRQANIEGDRRGRELEKWKAEALDNRVRSPVWTGATVILNEEGRPEAAESILERLADLKVENNNRREGNNRRVNEYENDLRNLREALAVSQSELAKMQDLYISNRNRANDAERELVQMRAPAPIDPSEPRITAPVGTVRYVVEHIKRALYHSAPIGVRQQVTLAEGTHPNVEVITVILTR